MAEAVILSAIESLDCWLLKREGLVEQNLEKLYNLIVGISDLGEEEKEMTHSLLLQFGIEELYYNLLDTNKENMYSLVVGIADFWEDYKGKLYNLLFQVAEGVDTENIVEVILGEWGTLDKEKLHSVLIEIADLWGDDEGELNKEDLHSLLFQMLNKDNSSKKKMMYGISGEVARLWKDKQPKLNKEKLYTWLAHKVDHSEPQYLSNVLHEEVIFCNSSDFHKPIRESVGGAKREFRMILDLIIDNKLGDESSLRYFISDLVDMARDADFLIHLQDSHPFALFFELSMLLKVCDPKAYPEWFGEKFKHIVNGLQEIKVSMLGFGVERLQNVREMEGDQNVVGLEEYVKLLLSHEGTTIISGMAGIGKTTLARQLYNHTTIAQQFDCRAWVCLSRMFSRKEILVSLIRQVVDSNELALLEKIECADYKSLKQVLRQQLMGIRYFIVLDDVWDNTTHLKYVVKALHRDNGSRLLLTSRRGSRLLLPTRNIYGGVNHHEMRSMDDDKSWTLLLKTLSIEGINERFPKPLVKQMRQILKQKCGGLPLAIKEVGRHWAKKRQSGSEWLQLIKSINLSETLSVLESAYHSWDQELQSSFLPLAFFKEGATIRAKKLVQIWMTMGVIQICLEELSRESIIDVIDRDKTGQIKKCCIHVVFHMLSIKKAEDELSFEILSKDGNHRPAHQPHHRVIYCSRENLMNYSSNQNKHLVSLFLYGGGYFNASPFYWKHFEQLKTLDMEDFGLKILPDAIGMLTELKYLGLRNNYIQELPHSLRCLKNLEVLDIALNFMVAVGDILWEMESLRHLYMSDISCQKPLRIDTLMNLETLTYISAHNWMYNTSKLVVTKLGIQEVDGNTDLKKLFLSLAKLEYLQFLILRGYHFKSMPSIDEIGILEYLSELKLDGCITRLPTASNFPLYIKRLSLVNSCLYEDPMPILEKLVWLRYLKLHNAYCGQQMVISHNGFSHLVKLIIEELWHLTNIQIGKGAMKILTDLEINNCANLVILPEIIVQRTNCPENKVMFKIKTTKKNATKLRESGFVSRIREVDIQP